MQQIYAQDLIPYYQNGKYGYCNLDKSTIVKPKYDGCGFFNEGLAWVKKKEKFGYINSEGQFIVEPTYSYASNFKNGTAIVYDRINYYIIDKQGKKLNKQGSQHAFRVADSLFVFDTWNNIWQVINSRGKKLYEFEDYNIMYFEDTDFITYIDSVTQKDIYLNLKTGKRQFEKPVTRFSFNNPDSLYIQQIENETGQLESIHYRILGKNRTSFFDEKYKSFLIGNNFEFVFCTTSIGNEYETQIYVSSKKQFSKVIKFKIDEVLFDWNYQPNAYQLINGKYYFLCSVSASKLLGKQDYICIDEGGIVYCNF